MHVAVRRHGEERVVLRVIDAGHQVERGQTLSLHLADPGGEARGSSIGTRKLGRRTKVG